MSRLPHRLTRTLSTASCIAAAVIAGGCSSSSSSPSAPTIPAARTYHLAGFRPTQAVQAGKPIVLAFTIDQPTGGALIDYRRGQGPHTGVHLIVVRKDLSVIIHRHPKVASDGSIRQPLVLPAPGPYRVLVDAYPNLSGPLRNFQLFANIRAAGTYRPKPLPPFRPTAVVDGYHVSLSSAAHLRPLAAEDVTAMVTDPEGRPVAFTPWYGALAHAIFFRKGSLDYFHTHVCGPGTTGCASVLGGATVTGRSSKPGVMHVGVLLPEAGTWRLFLQFKAGGRVLTAPLTLEVR